MRPPHKRYALLLLSPLVTLILTALWYVATGVNLLPGDHGARWFTLAVVSVVCLIARFVIGLPPDM